MRHIAGGAREGHAQPRGHSSAMQEIHAEDADARRAGAQEAFQPREQALERRLQTARGFRGVLEIEPLVETLRHDVAPAWAGAAAQPFVEFVEQLRPEARGKSCARQPQKVGDARDAEPGKRRDRVIGPLQAGERQPCRDPRHRVDAGHGHREIGAREPQRAACRRRKRERGREAAGRKPCERAAHERHGASEEIEASTHFGEHRGWRFEADDGRELQCPAPQAIEQRRLRRGPALFRPASPAPARAPH